MHICQVIYGLALNNLTVYRRQVGSIALHVGLMASHSMIVCVYYLTYRPACIIDLLMTTPAKKKALLASGTLNPHPEDVRSELFKMDFFDPWDRAQVKYEMLRAHSVDGDPVAEACRQFGFSRESFYQIQQAFSALGFISFLPGKPGRKGPVKLKAELLEFALEKKKENPDLDPAQLAVLIKQRYGTEIHRTTLMRGIKKTALAGRKARARSSPQAMIRYRRSMRTCAAKACRTWSRPPGDWNEFASMEWRACFQASRMTFRSSSIRRALLALPGAGRWTFTRRNCIRFMNSSSPRFRKYRKVTVAEKSSTRSTRVVCSPACEANVVLMDCPAGAGETLSFPLHES